MDRAGLVGDDGPTHHGAFDIAYLRPLPNIVLMAPRDESMLVRMLRTALEHDDGPIALRYPRGEGLGVPLPAPEDVRASTSGAASSCARATARWRSSATAPASPRGSRRPTSSRPGAWRSRWPTRASPSRSTSTLAAALAAEHELLVTVEEGVLAGGFGSAVWEALNDGGHPLPRILRVGLPDRYVTHGKPALLHAEVGFTGRAIAERIEAAVAAGSGALAGA